MNQFKLIIRAFTSQVHEAKIKFNGGGKNRQAMACAHIYIYQWTTMPEIV